MCAVDVEVGAAVVDRVVDVGAVVVEVGAVVDRVVDVDAIDVEVWCSCCCYCYSGICLCR